MPSAYSKKKRWLSFSFSSMLLGDALQITNTYGDAFLGSFAKIPEFADSFGVKHSVILLSISQMSETLFILAFLSSWNALGIKRVMLISMFAGIPIRTVWLWWSGIRHLDADFINDSIRYGIWFLQHFRFFICWIGNQTWDKGQCTRFVLHYDKRIGRCHRRICQWSRSGMHSLYMKTECWQVATGRLSGSYLQHMHWLSVFCLQLFSDTNINRENLRKWTINNG